MIYKLDLYEKAHRKISDIRVIDGDTIQALIHYQITPETTVMIKSYVRFARINAPEISTDEGVKVKQWLTDYIASDHSTDITIEVLKKDKYGRLLAEVIVNGDNLSDLLRSTHSSVKLY